MLSRIGIATDDLDQFRASVRPVERGFTLTGRGKFKADHSKVDLGEVWMQRADETVARAWPFQVRDSRIAITFLSEPTSFLGWRGLQATTDEILLCAPGTASVHSLFGAAKWGSMSMLTDHLTQMSIAMFGHDLRHLRNVVALKPQAAKLARLRRLHAAADRVAETAPATLVDTAAGCALEHALIEAMAECITTADTQRETVATRKRAMIAKRFQELAENCTGQALYLPQVCATLNVPARSLHVCSMEHLGISPRQFLLLRRIHSARDALRRPEVGQTVTEVATRFGFWELGRFAAFYRQTFGESPSETLRKARLERAAAPLPSVGWEPPGRG